MRRAAAAALALLLGLGLGLAPVPAAAADRRIPVDPNQPPWNAVAKLQTNIGSRCSGVLIAPAVVLTAAHCLYNPRTHQMLQPVSLHVLFGYERGEYRWHRLVKTYAIGKGFDWLSTPSLQSADWALVQLAEMVPATPLPIAANPPPSDMAVTLAGYNQDRAQVLLADPDCHVRQTVRQADGSLWLRHDCAGTHGTSGGPLLARQGEAWAVVGIAIAAGKGFNVALLPPLAELRSDLPH